MIKPNYLRLSVTNSCNLNCIYCAPVNREDIKLSTGKIYQLIKWFSSWGIRKVRITGGEPLMREDIVELIRMISNIGTITEVSLTTNGILLLGYLESLKSAGLNSINISLDTLDREKYHKITGKDKLPDVVEAINTASDMHFRRLGINMVVLEGINDDEIFDFLKISEERYINVRFIEFMDSTSYMDFRVPTRIIRKKIQYHYGKLIPIQKNELSGPSKYYKIKGFNGNIGFISYQAHNSCNSCNRLRLTSDGYLMPCLFSRVRIDIKNRTKTDIKKLFCKTCKLKQEINGLNRELHNTAFSQIGG